MATEILKHPPVAICMHVYASNCKYVVTMLHTYACYNSVLLTGCVWVPSHACYISMKHQNYKVHVTLHCG